jgi:hypothetical protein
MSTTWLVTACSTISLRVDRHLNVVADADLSVGGHGAAVRIGQRDLVLAGSVELGQHRLVTAALFSAASIFRRVFVTLRSVQNHSE